ncbi:MAG: PQQ-binding-like beta-propeller repeat protein [Opitutaceae bacterium]|nr:PQQ-binding-like beta-propeller repeat protein [Opitutaceae bacterium]
MSYPTLRLIGLFLASVLSATATAPDPIAGLWTGVVSGPQGATELTLQLARTDTGKFDVTVHMPRMHTYGFTFRDAGELADGRFTFAPLAVQLALSGESLVGNFGPGRLPVKLHRGGEPTPEPPDPVYPDAPSPRWTYSLGAPTWAAPVAEGGVVYVGANDGRFHAVHTADGTALWVWSGAHRIDGRAVIAGDAVLFVDGQAGLVCLARADGALRWRLPLHDAEIAGGPPLENPTFNRRTATPLVVEGTVYCGSSDGGLYAVDLASGRKLWRYEAGSPVFSGVAEIEPGILAFGCMNGAVVLLDRHSRTAVARYQTGGGVVTTPVLAGGNLIVGSRDYLLHAFNRADGRVAWQFSYWFSWVESTPRLHEGLIYVGASDYRRVSAFDPVTGREQWATDVRGLCWGTPAVTNDTVYIGTVAQNLPGTVIRHTGGVMALDRRTGQVIWQYRSPLPSAPGFGGCAGSLALADGCVIGAGFDGRLLAWPVP